MHTARPAPGAATRQPPPFVEGDELLAALDQEVLPKLVTPVHLEHQAAQVAQPFFAGPQQRAPLASQQSRVR